MRFRPIPGVRAVVGATLALALLAPGPALADGPLDLELRLGSRCLSGHKPTDQPVKVKLLRRDGKALETRQDASTDFEWSICFRDHVPVAGNRIRLTNGTFERTVSVPDLTLALDRVTNVVRGRAPAGRTIDLAYAACDSEGLCLKSPPVTVTANGHGRYRKDLSSASIDIDGSDIVRAIYTNSGGDRFYREGRAPYMTITGPNRFKLSCLPAGSTTVRLLSPTGVLRASRSSDTPRGCRTVSGTFRRNGHAVNIHTGDRIRSDFAGDARMVWPSPHVSASDYSYSGRCFSNVDWHLTIIDGDSIATYSGQTDADGRFSQMGYQLIAPGAALRLTCESIRGDRVTASGKAA
jgi:hypothetical protein